MIDFLVQDGGADRELADRYLQYRRDAEAVSHLYSVAAGIDSMVLGESEILGQVRAAFAATVSVGADEAVLSRLFHTAIRVGRRARAETQIGHHSLSISSIAAQQARALHADVESATVLMLGAGEAGRLAAEALVDHGAGRVLVVNRTAERGEGLADDLGGQALPFERLDEALSESDIVIAASGSPDHLVAREQAVKAMARRNGRPLVIIDIGLPRDFDPTVRDVPGVVYRDLDDLQTVAGRALPRARGRGEARAGDRRERGRAVRQLVGAAAGRAHHLRADHAHRTAAAGWRSRSPSAAST